MVMIIGGKKLKKKIETCIIENVNSILVFCSINLDSILALGCTEYIINVLLDWNKTENRPKPKGIK